MRTTAPQIDSCQNNGTLLVEMATWSDALVQDRKESDRKALSAGLRPFSKRLENSLQAGSKPPQKSSKRPPDAKKTLFKS